MAAIWRRGLTHLLARCYCFPSFDFSSGIFIVVSPGVAVFQVAMLRLLLREHKVFRHPQIFRRFASEKSVESVAKPVNSDGNDPHQNPSIHRRMHAPSDFERKVLVWVGRYKTIEEIPRTVPIETIERAKNKGRIKACNYAILLTILGCVYMIWSGKQAASRGESVQQMNRDWHQAVKEGKA